MKTFVLTIMVMSFSIFLVVSLNAENSAVPEVVMLDSLMKQYESVAFNHATHALIADSCAKCHHQHPIFETQSCNDCHSLNAAAYRKSVIHTFLSCRNCHDTYDPDNPSMPGLKVAYHRTCFECHRDIGNVGRDPKGCTEMCHAKKSEKISMKTIQAEP